MSRRPRKKDVPAQGAGRPTVSVCRGCCCGTEKIPGVDHAAQLARLRSGLEGTATVRAVECLDACEQGNVIVVQPSAEGRRAGGRPVWLGLVNDEHAEQDIVTWAGAGGPGLADAPDILDLYVFKPSRRVSAGLDG
ncbi:MULTISPECIES: (2Fe-2S) ferredoxin domain-containing protein [Streptomyces]|uniref:(2Fe-2S) ferredoxin domain-containing protein n=1 Tax=Streptomyces TaxID=1883 RepID=UPI001FAE64B8|nr:MULTISPECIES: (2Fe-2S) ferredoxin domain-containing protein [Streptomyces]MDX2917353.1 (2Fe-2S) ferredoxin domain-containing protein [Streptomyces sp. NE06-03C]MDX3605512.1 (2Fe-2S) ferredoxin domain-containing protein [Streptomyces sp. FL06-04B]MDX3736448.1 (2Fe-2S) ferredoxin domain-containing protein [Streptomyces sp. ID01-15D]